MLQTFIAGSVVSFVGCIIYLVGAGLDDKPGEFVPPFMATLSDAATN